MTEFCKCEHSEEEHDSLGLCEVPHCPCLGFVSDQEGDDDDDGSPEELELGE